MNHISSDELALYATRPDAVAPDRRTAIDLHLSACEACLQLRDILALHDDDLPGLGEADSWEPEEGSATYEALMNHASRLAEEDAQAEVLLKDLLDEPIQAAYHDFASRRSYRTLGVVRKLIATSRKKRESDLLAALTFADAATVVVDVLPRDQYPAAVVDHSRGIAWKERANAQLLMGDLKGAHESLDRAERAFGKASVNEHSLSIVALVRAGVLKEQERYDEALAMAYRAELGFIHSGAHDRRADAQYLRAGIMADVGRLQEAAVLFRHVIEYAEESASPLLAGRGANGLGNCYIDLGNLTEASLYFNNALAIFRSTGPELDRIVTEWGIARVILHGGRPLEAIRRLRQVAAEFEKGDFLVFAALADLDIVEALISIGAVAEVVPLARHLLGVFTGAGLLTSALSAIAYLEESAASGRLTTEIVKEIRSFLRKSERQPQLRFVPPPLPPQNPI